MIAGVATMAPPPHVQTWHVPFVVREPIWIAVVGVAGPYTPTNDFAPAVAVDQIPDIQVVKLIGLPALGRPTTLDVR